MTSPSTLIRQAKATKDPKKKKRLRAQAAKLRREIRAGARPAKPVHRVSRKRLLADALVAEFGWKALPESPARAIESMPQNRVYPGEGETQDQGVLYVGSGGQPATAAEPVIPISAERIEFLRRAALKRKGDGFLIAMRALFVDGKAAGRDEIYGQMHGQLIDADKRTIEFTKSMREAHAIQIVASFMARIQAAEKLNGGPLPASLVIDGLTAARVYDALREAGYTKDGKGGVNRADIRSRS